VGFEQTLNTVDGWRMSETLDSAIYSNQSTIVDGVMRRLTWKELYEQTEKQRAEARNFMGLCMDLNRCEHGRHEGDNCFGCEGASKGNPLLRPDRTLGYSIDGRFKYVLPVRECTNWTDFDNWWIDTRK
jgi:hypothetical protein